jgi:hypothetical protein
MTKPHDDDLMEIISRCAATLEAFTDRSGGPDACWIWTKSTTGGFGKEENTLKGYGQTGGSIDGKRWHRLCHRAAYEVLIGRPLAADECVLHRCDNPPCCNPAHLFLGDRNDNCQDKMDKGRHNYKTHHGSKHGMSKVTDEIVIEMRELYAAKKMTQTGLAERFGLSQASVWAILHRKTWAHV